MVRPNKSTLRGTAIERRYMNWLHDDMPCCLSARTDGIEIAHTGAKSMGMKAPLWTCLPMQHDLHVAEESGRWLFWANALPGEDHLAWAVRLFECFEQDDRESGLRLLMDMQGIANRAYLETILRRAA